MYVDLSQKAISNSCLINIMIIIKSAVKIQQGEKNRLTCRHLKYVLLIYVICTKGIKARNIRFDFNTGGTQRQVKQSPRFYNYMISL